MKIGLFDSGLGGLTILKSFAQELPEYDYVYFGDTKNLPYGDKSEEEIYELTRKAIESLFQRDCALVVIACNTASAQSLRKLQDEYLPNHFPDRKILGMIIPTVEEVVGDGQKNICLLATKRTVDSQKYRVELDKLTTAPVHLTQIATPELVPLIELNEIEAAATFAIQKIEAQAGESEAIILGCTHYTQVKNQLREHFVQKKIYSQDEIVAKKLFQYLQKHPEIESRLSKSGERTIHLTKHRPDYDLLMSQFLGGAYVAGEEEL